MAINLSTKKIKLIKFVVIISVLISIISVFYVMTQIKTIEIEDGEHISAKEIQDYLIKGRFDNNAIYLYLRNRYGDQPDIPFVEYVDVELKNRNTLKFTVYEKKIIGCTEYMNKYIYFDKDGYFVEQSDERLEDVAFVSGIDIKSMTLYNKMDVSDDSLFNTIMDITKLVEKYNISTDKIYFNKSAEVTIYSGDIKVLLGKKETYDEQIAKLVGLLESAKGMKGTFHLENYTESSENIIFDKK